jgi:hypothetical protein
MNKQQLIATSLLVACSVAGAQNLKPGLWEIRHKAQMDEAMAQMQKEMANMPPEERKKVEAMMAGHGAHGGAGGPGIKMCVTKDMAERNQVAPQRDDCKTVMQPRSGNTVKMSFNCSNPPASGEGQLTFASPEAYSLKMVVNSQVDGKVEKASMETTGKWLAADCGSVKPLK